ncbi:MBL fold metallo-hydrolase [Marinobacter sp.]|uniref:MBL fold metallo-hydrolase n=1 Tax=Marinobacter sp. TaxID=50741 RepID=UPI00384C95F3
MKLTFLGTRGYIDPTTSRHRRHTSTLVSYRRRRLMIDCGEDWRQKVHDIRPHAILITHAHPDHAFGLQEGSPCPVWATAESWQAMDDWPIEKEQRHVLDKRQKTDIEGMQVEAFPVIHSTRAPAVGYRITAGRVKIFYVPDVVWIEDRNEAFADISCYVGDGASIDENLVRRDKHGNLVGHTPVRTQLTWCQKEGVPRMIVTHCGSQIVAGDERKVGAKLRAYAEERGVDAEVATDGMEVVLR